MASSLPVSWTSAARRRVQAGAVEQDRLLGQPVEPPAGADADRRLDGSGAGCPPVDAFGRLRGDDRGRAVADGHVVVELVAPGNAAGSIDEDRLERLADADPRQAHFRHPDW